MLPNRNRRLCAAARALLAITCLGGGVGCTHNYYYAYDPCGPAPATTAVIPGAVSYGNVCEVPSRVVSPPAVVSTPRVVPNTPILSRVRPPRVVVSEPNGSSRNYAWRRADPDGMLSTRVEGALDDPTLTR